MNDAALTGAQGMSRDLVVGILALLIFVLTVWLAGRLANTKGDFDE